MSKEDSWKCLKHIISTLTGKLVQIAFHIQTSTIASSLSVSTWHESLEIQSADKWKFPNSGITSPWISVSPVNMSFFFFWKRVSNNHNQEGKPFG